MPEHPVAEFLAEKHREEPFRILDTSGTMPQEVVARYGLETITGYHPGIYKHHLELYKKIWRRDESDLVQLQQHQPAEIACPVILDMLNVKYIVTRQQIPRPGHEQVFAADLGGNRPPVLVYERESVRPRMYLAGEVVEMESEEMLGELCELEEGEVLVADEVEVSDGSMDVVDWEVLSPGKYRATVDLDAPRLLVLGVSWHPDWTAEVNERTVDVHRVNHGQVAMIIPAGSNRISVTYWAWDFYLGLVASMVAGVSSLMYLGRRWFPAYGRSQQQTTAL